MNLLTYIVSHDFLADLDKNHKYIILTDGSLGKSKRHIQRYSFADLFAKTIDKRELSDALIICIAQSLTVRDMFLIDQSLSYPHHRVSLNPWLMSITKKSMPEENDIPLMLAHHYQIHEPVSAASFCNLLYQSTPNYIRIHDITLPQKLATQREEGIIFVSGSDDHSELTILANMSIIDSVSAAIHSVTQGSPNMFDLFARSHISTTFTDQLKDSIAKTNRILIILDHKATEEIRLFLDNLIRKECGTEPTIQYLFPQYHLVSSILDEYIHEEARFDEVAITDHLGSIIDSNW